MFFKTLSRAPLALLAVLGALGTLGGGSGADAPVRPTPQPARPVVALPQDLQTRLLAVNPRGTATRAHARVAPATRHLATTGSRAAAAKLPKAKAPAAVTTAPVTHGPTTWLLLNQAIARIPGYQNGVATWEVTSRYGHWGATDLSNGRIYISPNVSASRVYDVAAHEYGHARAGYNYGWDQQSANLALSRWFGGGTTAARERSADCMAIALGATWTSYTSCADARWRQGARILLSGQRLP